MPSIYVEQPKKILFFSIAKNASIATSHWLRELVGEYTKVNGHTEGINVEIRTGLFYLSECKKDGYYTFAVVRNPWARMYSAYADYADSVDEVKDKLMELNGWSEWPSFTDFIKNLDKFEISGLENWNGKKPAGIVQQTEFLDAEVDLIVEFENMEESLKPIEDMFELDFPIKIDHSKDFEYRDNYTEETKEIIAKFFKDDIEKWGYTF